MGIDRRSLGTGALLLAAGALMTVLLGPTASAAATPSLAHIDSAFMTTFFAGRRTPPFGGGKFRFAEVRETRSADSQAECRERREFRLWVPMENVPTPDGALAWSEYGRYVVMLCERGPLSPGQVQATIDASLGMLKQQLEAPQPELQQLAGFPLQIGDRQGRVAVLFEFGHGVIAVPLAVIASVDPRTSLVVLMDEEKFGEQGHEVKPRLLDLGDLLRAVDTASRASQNP